MLLSFSDKSLMKHLNSSGHGDIGWLSSAKDVNFLGEFVQKFNTKIGILCQDAIKVHLGKQCQMLLHGRQSSRVIAFLFTVNVRVSSALYNVHVTHDNDYHV